MQTFLPESNFFLSAQILDNKRLGKQRVECLQILKALRGETKGWRYHPATMMWAGHEECLGVYMNCMIDEWERRGFRNTIKRHPSRATNGEGYWPAWLLDWDRLDRVVSSHRSNLLRKDPEFYAIHRWQEPPDLPYFWPVSRDEFELQRVLRMCP